MKIQITSYYSEGECPLTEDGRLMVGDDYWLEPSDPWSVVSNVWKDDVQEGELTIEIDVPDELGACRFLRIANGSAPACYGFGNAQAGTAHWMEDAPDGFAPDLVCMHCDLYTGEREARQHEGHADIGGYWELLPELDEDEVPYPPPFFYINRKTGEIEQ